MFKCNGSGLYSWKRNATAYDWITSRIVLNTTKTSNLGQRWTTQQSLLGPHFILQGDTFLVEYRLERFCVHIALDVDHEGRPELVFALSNLHRQGKLFHCLEACYLPCSLQGYLIIRRTVKVVPFLIHKIFSHMTTSSLWTQAQAVGRQIVLRSVYTFTGPSLLLRLYYFIFTRKNAFW